MRWGGWVSRGSERLFDWEEVYGREKKKGGGGRTILDMWGRGEMVEHLWGLGGLMRTGDLE